MSIFFTNPFLAFACKYCFFVFFSYQLSVRIGFASIFFPRVFGLLYLQKLYNLEKQSDLLITSTYAHLSPSLFVIILLLQTIFFYSIFISFYYFKFRFILLTSKKQRLIQNDELIDCKISTSALTRKYQFNLRSREILGMLGPSQCGKSYLLQFLLGQLPLRGATGEVSVLGQDILKRRKVNYGSIGYCFDYQILEQGVTIFEQLYSIGSKRRIIKSSLMSRILFIAKALEFEDYINQKISQLSEGTKRKVSLAIALIGLPQLLFLDQPTKGVDQLVGKSLMKVIRNLARRLNQGVILSSKRKGDISEVADICLEMSKLKDCESHKKIITIQMESKSGKKFKITNPVEFNEVQKILGQYQREGVTWKQKMFLIEK